MIHVYTGKGKGKTTAALGLVMRAVGAGLRVYIGQFIKGKSYSELRVLRKLPSVKIEQYGSGCFIKHKAAAGDIELANKGLKRAKQIVAKAEYDLVILDEINVATHLGLLKVNQVVNLLKSAPANLEIILTGRWANPEIIKIADLVSEIKDIKHYYKKGKKARKGIEF